MVRLYMEFKRNLATEIEKKIIAITPVEKNTPPQKSSDFSQSYSESAISSKS